MTMYPEPPCKECEEYVEVLKEQLEEKNRLTMNLFQEINELKQQVLLLKEELKGTSGLRYK